MSELLADLRAECRDAWIPRDKEALIWWELANGPLRGERVPEPAEGRTWQGTWFDDAGQQILVTYELNDEGVAEYSGSKTMADIATDTTNAAFEPLRDHGDEPDVDLDKMPEHEARDFLRLDNERRRTELFEASDGQVDLTNAFDLLEILTLLRHLVAFTSSPLELDATLDFENQVSLKLDEIQTKYEEFTEARDIAQRQAVLQGNAPPGTPIHNGRVTMPARRVRRGG